MCEFLLPIQVHSLPRFALRLSLLLLISVRCPVVIAQDKYLFENLTTADGLSDNRITCIRKDKTGFIWIGTENGLNRYDGREFYKYSTGLDRRLSNAYINDVEQGKDGRIWVATQGGLNVIDPVNDSITVFLANGQTDTEGLPSDMIWDVHIDSSDRVWLAPDARDLFYYDTRGRKFHSFPWKQFARNLFPGRSNPYLAIRRIYEKSDDELWLGTSVGLFSFSISRKAFAYHSSQAVAHFIQLQSSADGSCVYFTQSPYPKLQILSVNSGVRKDIDWEDIPTSDFPSAPDTVKDRLTWLPAGKDILGINTITHEGVRISHVVDEPGSMLPGNVRITYQDDNGMVWVGTSAGVSRFNPSMTPFKYTRILNDHQPEDLQHDLYRTNAPVHTVFYSKKEGRYYISSPSSNQLLVLDKATGVLKSVSTVGDMPLTTCSVIFEDKLQRLWVLATPHAFVFDRVAQSLRPSTFRSGHGNQMFTDMAEDGKGRYWFACFGDGLYEYNPESGEQRKLHDDTFKSTLPTSLYYDQDSRKLWIGTFEYGLFIYDVERGTFIKFLDSKNTAGYMSSALITDIVKDNNNEIWISTYSGGLLHCSSSNTQPDKFTHIGVRHGLPEDNIYSLQADQAGNIWATSYNGLVRVADNGKAIDVFDRSRGLGETDLYSPITMTADGDLIAGINQGFVQFHPDDVRYHTDPFPVVAKATLLNSEPVRQKTSDRQLVLAHDNSGLEISFAALTYVKPLGTTYEYKLDGMNTEWISGNSGRVRYHNLPAGHYIFRVRAIDFMGTRSANEAVVTFQILPPWWATWWFRVTCAILLVCGVWIIFTTRVRSVKRSAALQRQMAELKGQAIRSQMNPHFIFNSLNAIQELVVTENYPGAYQYLAKFSRLLRMVLDSSEKDFVPLRDEVEICRLYVELESLRFRHSFRYSIDTESADEDVILFPALLVQPFVENAIWHGLMQKEGEKILSVKFEERENAVLCTIEDNGIGMRRAAEIKAGKTGSAHFASKGIPLAMQRADALRAGGHKAEINISDRMDEHGMIAGTRVVIQVSYDGTGPPHRTRPDRR